MRRFEMGCYVRGGGPACAKPELRFGEGRRAAVLGIAAALVLALPGPSFAAGTVPAPAEAAAEESGVGNYLAGRFAHHRFDLSVAAAFMAHALGEDPDNPTLVGQTFLLTAAAGRLTEALKLARRVVEQDPTDPIANYVLASEDLRAGDFAAAEARLDQVDRQNLNRFLAPVLTAWAGLGQGKTKQAFESLAANPKVESFDVLRRLHLGYMNEFVGDMAAAEEALEGA
ncbi:MAG: tetratricopeptide repeat protein, partial [Kiloniellales bacterium]